MAPILETVFGFMTAVLAQPAWVAVWIGGMAATNFSGIFFLGRRPARAVLFVFLLSVFLTMLLFHINGYNRLHGLGHVVTWTPLLFYLSRQRGDMGLQSAYTAWLLAVFVTDFVSLIIDYADVIRYLLAQQA